MSTIHNFYLDQGTDFHSTFSLTDNSGSPIDLTTSTLSAKFSASEGNVFLLDVRVLDAMNGQISLNLSAVDSISQSFQKSGTVSVAGNVVTGIGTQFFTDFITGDIISINNVSYTIASIIDDNHLTILGSVTITGQNYFHIISIAATRYNYNILLTDINGLVTKVLEGLMIIQSTII
jgi:hypothetical protein